MNGPSADSSLKGKRVFQCSKAKKVDYRLKPITKRSEFHIEEEEPNGTGIPKEGVR